jgi:hypothetical protein
VREIAGDADQRHGPRRQTRRPEHRRDDEAGPFEVLRDGRRIDQTIPAHLIVQRVEPSDGPGVSLLGNGHLALRVVQRLACRDNVGSRIG